MTRRAHPCRAPRRLLRFNEEPAGNQRGRHGASQLGEYECGYVGRPDAGEVSVSARATVTAGFANEVEEVNQ
jgi:hypothetical protein